MARSLDAVLFDLDGTLVDSVDLILASFRHTMAVYAAHPLPSDDVWLARIGEPLSELLAPYAERFGEPLSDLVATYRDHYVTHHDACTTVFAGVEQALATLAAVGVALGVVSGKTRVGIERTLVHTGLDRFFEVRVGADDCDEAKPEPGPLLMAAAHLGVSPERVAYVGDAPVDIRAARAAGMRAVAVRWGPFSAQAIDPLGPDEVLVRPEEIVRLLE